MTISTRARKTSRTHVIVLFYFLHVLSGAPDLCAEWTWPHSAFQSTL